MDIIGRRRKTLSERELLRREGKPVYLKDIDTWMLVCVIAGKVYLRAMDGGIVSPEDHDIYPHESEEAV